jgi:predicted DNA-binding transcriptional regulator AlpA
MPISEKKTPSEKTAAVARRAYRINEACAALGISRSGAYLEMSAGRLPYVVICGRRHIPADTVEALVRGEHPSQTHQPRPTRRRKGAA